VKLGDYVSIGAGSVVEAASIGNMVQIGRDCVVGALCILRDCVKIEDGSVVAPGTTIPSFSIYAGSPGRSLQRKIAACLSHAQPSMSATCPNHLRN
jgi:dynactin-5